MVSQYEHGPDLPTEEEYRLATGGFPHSTPRPWYVNDLRASRMRELGWTGPSVDVIHIIDRPPSEIAKTGDGYNAIIAKINFDNRAEELQECNIADAELIVTAVNAHADLQAALKRAADMLHAVAGDLEDGYSLDSLRGKYVMAVLGARDAAYAALKLARAET